MLFDPSERTGLTIGQLAHAAHVGVETIRYYQRRKLIKEPIKPPFSIRRYPTETVNRVRFIKRAQELGFSLNEVLDLLRLGDGACAQTREIAEQKRAAVAARIRDLEKMQKILSNLIETCRPGKNEPCPLFESLSHDLEEIEASLSSQKP